ncbi:MAG: hypothetical protein ACN4GG_02130 [Akkermansiaceae bacterium]
MTYSLLISALIIGIAAFIGLPRQKKLKELRTEWSTLQETCAKYDISDNPTSEFVLSKLSERRKTKVRTEKVDTFSEELITFMKEMKEAQRNGEVDRLDSRRRGMEIFSRMMEFSPGEIKRLVENITSDTSIDNRSKTEMVMMSVMTLSQEDPLTALAIISETKDTLLKGNRMSQHFIGFALGQLAADDPTAAMEWLKNHQDEIGGVSSDLKKEIISGAAQQNLNTAFSLLSEMEFDDSERPYYRLAMNVTLENATDYITEVRSLDGTLEEKKKAFSALSTSTIWKDFETATAWMAEAQLKTAEKESLISGIHYHSTKGEITQWLDWLHSENNVVAKKQGESLIRSWTHEDFRAAGEWVNGLELGARRDDAAYHYASTLRTHEPEAARVWAETLPDSERKTKLLNDIEAAKQD